MRDTLPEFQKYMLDRKLVAENKTTFFAYWVVRFLSYAKRHKYSTERTYLQWAERFFAYIAETGGKQVDAATAEDVRDFLSHLALEQRVSASTQNQAFNALLFLFRNVFNKDLGNLDTTIRAKRGPKLPVVLSVDEVKRLFEQMTGANRLMAELLYGAGLRLMELARLRMS